MAKVVETVLSARVEKAGFDEATRKAAQFDAAVGKVGKTAGDVRAVLQTLQKTDIIDESQFRVASARADELAASIKATGTEIDQARKKLEGLTGDELTKQEAKVARLERQYISLQSTLDDVPRGLIEGFEKAQREADRLASYDFTRSRLNERFGQLGDIDTALVTVGSAAGGAGARGVQTSLTQAADIFAVSEQVALVGGTLKTVGKNAAESSGLIGDVATGLQKAVPGLSASAAGLFTLGAAGLALAVTAGALALAFKQAADEAKAAKERTEEAVTRQRELSEFLATATTEDAEARIKEIEDQQRARQQASDQLQSDLDIVKNFELDAGVGRALAAYFDSVDEVTLDTFRQWAEENRVALDQGTIGPQLVENFDTVIRVFEKFGGRIDSGVIEQALEDIASEGDSAAQQINEITQSIRDGVVAENDFAAAREKSVTEAEQNLQRVQAEEQTLVSQREQAVAAIDQLREQEQSLIEDRKRNLAEQEEDRTRAEVRAAEDRADELAKREERIADIRAAGAEQLIQLERSAQDQINERVKQANKQQEKLLADSDVKKRQIETDFIRDSLKQQADYNEQRADADKDLNNTIFDALISNDIIAITRAQRQAKTDEERRDREYQQESEERARQKDERLQELRDEQAVRLTEIKAGLEEERQQISEQLVQRVAETKERLQDQLVAEREAAEEQDRIRERQLRRQEEDQQIADQRSEAAFQRQIARIDEQERAQVAAMRNVQQAIYGIQLRAAQLNAFINDPAATNLPSSPRAASSSSTSVVRAGTSVITPFADGGIVPRNRGVMGYFEPTRNYDEMVLPLKRSVLDSLGLMGGGGSTFNFGDISINGDGVTADDVRQAMREFGGALNQAIQNAKMGA